MENKTINEEAGKLSEFILEKIKQSDKDFVELTHKEISPFVQKDKNNKYNNLRVSVVLRPKLRKNKIQVMPIKNGYRFFAKNDSRNGKKIIRNNPTNKIEVINKTQNFVSETNTDFQIEYIKPNIYFDVKNMIDAGLQVLIVGPPGCGKSRIFEEISIENGIKPIRRAMSQIHDIEQLIGGQQIVIDKKSGSPYTKFVLGSLTKCVSEGMFFIGDEYDNATPECNESLKTITEKGGKIIIETQNGIEVYKKHKKFRIGFTSNTWGRGDSSGNFPNANRQNDAFLDRIDAIVEMGYSVDLERKIMKSLNMPNHIIEIFYGNKDQDITNDPAKAGLIQSFRTTLKTNEISGSLGMRKIISFCTLYNIMGWHKSMLYGIINKFEKENHGFFERVIRSKMGSKMIPTNDESVIESAQDILSKYRLK